ncbi:MAG: alkaline phosphatase family protein [Desulfobacteraceae bacterium]|nr:alkaline phosphatase family protein [Desulfobacteraceae bacterium]
MKRTAVINVVGLTRSLLGENTPCLNSLAAQSANIRAVTPAVTCTAQSTYLTGKAPAGHGIVGNGWYFRDLSQIWFWRQSNRLVQGEKIWDAARRLNPDFTCANICWWYNMVTDADWAITPRPLYCADGRKIPDCYSIPMDLRDRFNRKFGQFPLFNYWGPLTSIASSQWIAKAAMAVEQAHQPTLNLIYLPHLDYNLQRLGPDGDIGRDLAQIDNLCATLTGFFQQRGCRVVVLSEYGITPVSYVAHPNRILRDSGFLSIKVDLGREYLDPGTCRAFAVSDHQVAHIYVKNPNDISAVKSVFENVHGVAEVLDQEGKKAYELDHKRSGDLILIAQSNAWFSYYYWQDDSKAPDYARTVNIHSKPGYDPCELFIDPDIAFPKLKTGYILLKKMLGFRYLLDIIPLNPALVKGSHGRITKNDDDGPIFMTSEPSFLDASALAATDVYDLLLKHVFSD